MGYCLSKAKLSQGFSVAKLHSLVNNNSQINLFVWDPTEPVATRPLFMLSNPGSYKFFYTFDGNKNVSELVHFESRNGIAAHYDYAPFGAVTRAVNTSAISARNFSAENPFRFSSEYHDDTLGLVYYNYRHYNPIDGRWCGRDPIVSSLNLFLFTNNNAITQKDANGLKVIVETRKIEERENNKGIDCAETFAPRIDARSVLEMIDCPSGCEGYKTPNWDVEITIKFYANAFRNNNFSKVDKHEMHHVRAYMKCYEEIDHFWTRLFTGICRKNACTQAKVNLANAFAMRKFEAVTFDELIFDRIDYSYLSLTSGELFRVRHYFDTRTRITLSNLEKANAALNEAEREFEDECNN